MTTLFYEEFVSRSLSYTVASVNANVANGLV